MESQFFRKKAMDRLSSPEELNDYLRVTSPALWVVLAAVARILAGGLILSSVTYVNSFVSGTAEVSGGKMTVRFDDDRLAENVQAGLVHPLEHEQGQIARRLAPLRRDGQPLLAIQRVGMAADERARVQQLIQIECVFGSHLPNLMPHFLPLSPTVVNRQSAIFVFFFNRMPCNGLCP